MTIYKKIFVCLFLFFIFGIGLLNSIASDRNFSERENRPLAQMPAWTLEHLLTGKFMARFEVYLSDQFVWKDHWVMLKAVATNLSLQKDSNGVFIGKDGFLIESFEKPSEQFDTNLAYVKKFATYNEHLRVYTLLVPSSISFYTEKLPLFAQTANERAAFNEAKDKLGTTTKVIDVFDTLQAHKKEYIYFKTDHHWTMRGAYYAYQEIAKSMGIKPNREEDFHIQKVSNRFYGTLHSKANIVGVEPDEVEVFLPKFQTMQTVTYDDSKQSDSLYEWSYLEVKDKYSTFLNGNHALVTIQTGVKNNRKLAVIKDSYSHTLIPFLANHFEEIHVIDLRYYHANVRTYLQNQSISEVLFLYSIGNFTKDPNIPWLSQTFKK